MQSYIAKETRLSSFCLIDLAIRESFVDFLFDCLLEALRNTEDELNIDPSPIELPSFAEAAQFRSSLIKKLTKAIKSDDEGSFVKSYFNLVATSEFDLVKDISPNLLACDVDALLNFLNTNSSELPKLNVSKVLQIYRAKPYQPYKSFTKQSLLLTPFYYLVHLPFWPPNEGKRIRPLIFNNLKKGSNSISELAITLCKSNLYVRIPFLRFLLLNDEQVLFIDSDKENFSPINEVIKDFDLCARLVERKTYASWELSYFLPVLDIEAEAITEVSKFKIYPAKIINLMSHRVNPDLHEEIDWLEVGAKLLSQHENSEANIQGLPSVLHTAMVELLLARGNALKKIDFEKAIGFQIHLEPDLLPPGRIMAYVTHPRFLTRDEAYYVLSDWVETEVDRRGKIPRNRIATPFVVKAINFTRTELFNLINADDLYQLYGIVDIDKISHDMAMALPSKPHEPYYLRKIKENISSILTDEMVYLGLVFFIRKDLCPARLANEALDFWRSRVVSIVMNAGMDIKAEITSIENAVVRSSFIRMIR